MLRTRGLGLCLLAIWPASGAAAVADEWKASSDFEGGPVRVASVDTRSRKAIEPLAGRWG